MAECPLCDASLDVEEDELDEGDNLVCEECGASLRVAGLNPVEMEEVEEDLEEEDDDDDKEDDKEEDVEEEDDDPWRSSRRY